MRIEKEVSEKINRNIKYQKDTRDASNLSVNYLEHINKRDKEYNEKLAKVYEKLERVIERRDTKMEACKKAREVDRDKLEIRLEKKIETCKEGVNEKIKAYKESTSKTMAFIVVICSVLTNLIGVIVGYFWK